jgi:beta-lactamase superfamily II metal-dependent hydrolase
MNKKAITLLFFLTTIMALGQTNIIDKPPKKTWKILIKNTNNKEVNYKLIGQTAIDNDFSIERKDFDFLTLQTSPKVTDGKTSSYFLKFIAKDNLIVLTGMAKSRINTNLGNIDEEYLKISNVGMKGSISKDQFNSMLNFAKLFFDSEYEFITE